MSKPTDSSLFIVSSVPALYQRLFSEIAGYEELGNRVLRQIRTAYSFRQVEQVRELAEVLIHVPIGEFQLIAQYYLVWCQCRKLEYHGGTLERIIEQTRTYKAQALLSRGTFEVSRGNPESALYFYTEGLRTSPTISEYIGLSRAIAVLKAQEGFHDSALRDMETLIPQIRHAEPRLYYDFLNSYAVELIEANRLTEAENISRSVVSSPFAPYYPEWRETREDISGRRVSRSRATFSAAAVPEPTTLLHMPVRERNAPEPFAAQRAVVFDLLDWKKKKMTNKDERPPKPVTSEEKQARVKAIEKLGGREMLMQIMNALGDESVENDKLRKALLVLEGLDED